MRKVLFFFSAAVAIEGRLISQAVNGLHIHEKIKRTPFVVETEEGHIGRSDRIPGQGEK